MTVVKAEPEGRQLEAAGFQIEIFYVVKHRVPENVCVFIFKQSLYALVNCGEGRLLFKFRILVG